MENTLKYILNSLRDLENYVFSELQNTEKEKFKALFHIVQDEKVTLLRENEVLKVNKTQDNQLILTNKEIKKMPKNIKNILAIADFIVHYRIKQNGVFEARFHRSGIDIEVSAKDLTTLREKFLRALVGYNDRQQKKRIPFFKDYISKWLDVKYHTTKFSTYSEYQRLVIHNLIPKFGAKRLNEIDRLTLQDFLFDFVKKGKHRTAEHLQLILNCIFNLAFEDFDLKNPMKRIELPYHEPKKGKALTLSEEKKLIDFCIKNINQCAPCALLVLLFFGLRKSELKTISVDNESLYCITSKTRLGKNEVKRRIPFTPVFLRFKNFINFETAKNVNLNTLTATFKRLFPDHHPHELRYTFITRCKECGVNPEIVMLWDGHEKDEDVKSSKVDRGYTDFSWQFQLSEAKKVDYTL